MWAYHQELQELQQRLQQQQQQQQQQSCEGFDWEFRPELYVRLSRGKAADAAQDTEDLLQQTAAISNSYSYNEWELRRQVLQQVQQQNRSSTGMQTLLSSFRTDAETQFATTAAAATNTPIAAAAAAGQRSSRAFAGLRGVSAQANKPMKELILKFNF